MIMVVEGERGRGQRGILRRYSGYNVDWSHIKEYTYEKYINRLEAGWSGMVGCGL